jgi:hypothetical protein
MNEKIKRAAFIFLIALLLSSCAEEAPPPSPTNESLSFKFFQDGYYKVVVPDWEESLALDQDSIFTVQREGQFIAVNRYQNLPEIFADQFLAYIEDDPNAFLVQQSELDGKPYFEFTNRENNQTIRLYAVLDYCQGQTYALVAGGRDTVENAELINQVLSSSKCDDPNQISDLESGKIGMVVNPANDDFWEGYYPALSLAKTNGVQVVHSYLLWGQVEEDPGEYNWDWQDALMGYRFHEGFEVSLVINLIHTTVRGPIPEDLQDRAFDDPEFIERFTSFVLELLERYPVQYLSIGNEVNDYFITHRDEIPAYQTFFTEVKNAIQKQHPDVMVGMTFAYHDAEYSNSLDIIRQLNLGDFLPLTLYIYSRPGFVFDQDPTELEGYFNRILELAGDTPVALVEIGWNTAESLGGNQEDQAAFVREVFRLLDQHSEQIQYIAWFELHDTLPENSRQAALTFIPEGSQLLDDEEFMAEFVDFINYLGLFESDGTPKEAWFVFQEEAGFYLLNQPQE